MVILLTVSLFTRSIRAQEPSGPTYTVQSGDTLYDIALRFGVTIEDLQANNGITDPSTLAIGQVLVIPGFESVTGALAAHTVEPGETLASVSLRFGVSQANLVKLNHLLNPDRLYAGESLVMLEGGDGSRQVANGRVVSGAAGESLLAVAARVGVSPWVLALANEQGAFYLSPRVLAVPGDARPITALPEPVLELRINPLPPIQGKSVSIGVRLSGPAEVNGSLGAWPLHFNEEGEWRYALQGLDALAAPNLYPLTLSITPPAGPEIEFAQSIPMRDGAYGYDPPLVVDPSVVDPAVVDPELEQVRSIAAPVTPTRDWTGLFLPPSSGRVVSFFGWRRSYNGSAYDTVHTGADYAGGTGTPIFAPAPGIVVFAGPLTVRGNATLIDHGWGVYSGYWHQSEIQVTVGQRVNAGDQIGLVGRTGRATGPHLHWEMWVGGVQVDPVEWTEIPFP